MRKALTLALSIGSSWALGLGVGVGGVAGFGHQSVKMEDTSGVVLADYSSGGLLYGGGLRLDIWVQDNLGVDLGAGKLLYSFEDKDLGTTTKRGALSIPLSVKYGVPLAVAKPYFGLGLEVLRWDKKFTVADSAGNEAEFEDQDPDTDFGLLLGAGVNLKAGPLTVSPELRFMYNLTPKDADQNEDALKTYSATHYDLRFGLYLLYFPPLVGE